LTGVASANDADSTLGAEVDRGNHPVSAAMPTMDSKINDTAAVATKGCRRREFGSMICLTEI
jgi:hypothetical protein